MNKISTFAKNHVILYCIIIEVFLLSFLFLEATLIGHIVPKGNYYVSLSIQEAIAAILACGLLQVSGLRIVLQNRGCGFFKGLLVGMYLLVISFLSIILYVSVYTGKRHLQDWYMIVIYIACMICVGITEEFVFRGIIATLLLKKFGTGRAGIWAAVIVSGILFGAAHISNIFTASPNGVFVQAAIAAMLGMLLATIYFRTGCIWVTVVLHALVDIAAAITTGLYGGGTMSDTVSAYQPTMLLFCGIYLIVLLVLLRKSKLDEIEDNMKPILEDLMNE
jgi:membrane protease YdiL (CAAX protease family)